MGFDRTQSSIGSLVEDIGKGKIRLPEIQRDYERPRNGVT